MIKDDIKNIDQIIIDKEYPGWEHLIKDYLLREVRRVKSELETSGITFKSIGKKSGAHIKAYRTTQGRSLPDVIVEAKDVLRFAIK